MSTFSSDKRKFPWRSAAALFFFLSAMVGFYLGVAVSERPDVTTAGLLTRAYYSLSLFVVGGVDLGTPTGGPLAGRVLLWLSYFGAPVLAASTLIEALLQAIAPRNWRLLRLRDHIIVVGTGELALAYLRVLRDKDRDVAVIVVGSAAEAREAEQYKATLGLEFLVGDIVHASSLQRLHVQSARRIFLFDEHSLRNYETASKLISHAPGLGQKIVIHCSNLRFMRAMESTRIARSCHVFNMYNMAATVLVRDHLIPRFNASQSADVVVIAGFGRFGQTIAQELQRSASKQIDTVAIIELDAHRKVQVADEQLAFAYSYRRELFEGDIAYPEVWEQLSGQIAIGGDNSVFVLGTGREEENLRTALWLRRNYPQAMIVARSSQPSRYAAEVGEEHDILSISIYQLVGENIPRAWISA